MYNLIEYSDNYADTRGSLWQFKRDEANMNNGNPADVTADDSTSFKYNSSLLGNPAAAGANALLSDAKIVVPLKYVSSFFRSLEMQNPYIHLSTTKSI